MILPAGLTAYGPIVATSWQHLTDGTTSVLVAIPDDAAPRILHLGAALGDLDAAALVEVGRALERPVPGGALDIDPPLAVLPEPSRGSGLRAGVEGARDDATGWNVRFSCIAGDATDDGLRWALADDVAGLAATIELRLSSGVVSVSASVTNTAKAPYRLGALRLAVPLPGAAQEALTFAGRWGLEAQLLRTPIGLRSIVLEGRRGRTGHERNPTVVVGEAGFGEQRGEVWLAHLGWSGSWSIVVDGLTDGRRVLTAEALLVPGEIVLGEGESFATPILYVAHSAAGMSEASRRFHRFVRAMPGRATRARPVIANTWEAVYFDHDLTKLTALADRAAACGVERFVLDDGWFLGRRDDTKGLGDWTVDLVVWPNGLAPIIDHVRSLGLEFGLWVEPEMVNPDSDLLRAHPDWPLSDGRHLPLLGRNQLVLDLGRPEVAQHLFDRLDALLTDHDIAYLKWDHNRELFDAATVGGRAGLHGQTLAVYALLDRLRAAHPAVEIESCASGGGRIDLGILARTDRVWTSDSNDALDRQSIQRGTSLIVPPELMGAHIGAPHTHISGRTHTLAFRAATAMFGHLGIEWNLLSLSDAELADVAAVVALHKQLRPLLHGGDIVRLDVDAADSGLVVHGVVAADRSEAVFAFVQTTSPIRPVQPPVRLPGLDPDRTYDVRSLRLPGGLGIARTRPAWLKGGSRLTGRTLAAAGVQPPVLWPETAMLVHITSPWLAPR